MNPFPLTTVENEQKILLPHEKLHNDLSEVLLKVKRGQIRSRSEAEVKYEEWKSRPQFLKAGQMHPKELESLTEQWENMIATFQQQPNPEVAVSADPNSAAKKGKNSFLQKIKNSKYSTLPSMPLRLKFPRSLSTHSIPDPPMVDRTTSLPRYRSQSDAAKEINETSAVMKINNNDVDNAGPGNKCHPKNK